MTLIGKGFALGWVGIDDHGMLRVMKLATLNDGSRDGQLVVVSNDLRQAHLAGHIAPTLQAALDDWQFMSPQLQNLFDALNLGRSKYPFDFQQAACMAPLPRAYQWLDGSAYPNHFTLLNQSRNLPLPDFYYESPCIYQGGSDDFLSGHEDARFADDSWGIDFEVEICVVTTKVMQGSTADAALESIALIGLVNDWSLRNLVPPELEKQFGFLQSKPSTAFAPIFVTPDSLGEAWQDGKLHLPVEVKWNSKKVGNANAGKDMAFNFPSLIRHACRTRNLMPGTILGGGTISNQEAKTGYSCIAEARAREIIADGKPMSEYMRFGDRIHIEVRSAKNLSVFGAIDQQVTQSTVIR